MIFSCDEVVRFLLWVSNVTTDIDQEAIRTDAHALTALLYTIPREHACARSLERRTQSIRAGTLTGSQQTKRTSCMSEGGKREGEGAVYERRRRHEVTRMNDFTDRDIRGWQRSTGKTGCVYTGSPL